MASFTAPLLLTGILARERSGFPDCTAVGLADLKTGTLLASSCAEDTSGADLDLISAAAGDLLGDSGEMPWADETQAGREVLIRSQGHTFLLLRCGHDDHLALIAACASTVPCRALQSFGRLTIQSLGRCG